MPQSSTSVSPPDPVSVALDVLRLFPKGTRFNEIQESVYNHALQVVADHIGADVPNALKAMVPATNPPVVAPSAPVAAKTPQKSDELQPPNVAPPIGVPGATPPAAGKK